MSENSIRLTQYSHGAGCGCKISPKVLETILHSEQAKFVDRICLWVMNPRRCGGVRSGQWHQRYQYHRLLYADR